MSDGSPTHVGRPCCCSPQGVCTSRGLGSGIPESGSWHSSVIGCSGASRRHAPPAGVPAVVAADGLAAAAARAAAAAGPAAAPLWLEASTVTGELPSGVLLSAGPVGKHAAAQQQQQPGTPPPSAAVSVAAVGLASAPAACVASPVPGAAPLLPGTAPPPVLPPQSPTAAAAAAGHHPRLSALPTYGWQRCLVDFGAITFCRQVLVRAHLCGRLSCQHCQTSRVDLPWGAARILIQHARVLLPHSPAADRWTVICTSWAPAPAPRCAAPGQAAAAGRLPGL